jgi:hypothetical protein
VLSTLKTLVSDRLGSGVFSVVSVNLYERLYVFRKACLLPLDVLSQQIVITYKNCGGKEEKDSSRYPEINSCGSEICKKQREIIGFDAKKIYVYPCILNRETSEKLYIGRRC